MGIVRFALKFPYTFYVLATLVMFLGSTAIISMPMDIFPQINIPVVTIVWQYTGLSTPEMEQRVTTYSQFALSSSAERHLGSKDILPARREPGSRDFPDRVGDEFHPPDHAAGDSGAGGGSV